MKSYVAHLAMTLMAAWSLGSTSAADDEGKKGRVVCDKTYKLISPRDQKEIGTYRIKAIAAKATDEVLITESIAMEYRGKKAEMRSEVSYGVGALVKPKGGAATTWINGKVCMKGSVSFGKGMVDIKSTGFLNKRTAEALDPPRAFEEKGVLLPEGTLLFQSAFPVLAPRLLPKEGELENVVFIEFPDDLGAPELIHLKEGYRLVRGKANEAGVYTIKVIDPPEDLIAEAKFSKDGQLLSFVSFAGMALVEVVGKE